MKKLLLAVLFAAVPITLNAQLANDECSNAAALPVNTGTECLQTVGGTLAGSTNSGTENLCEVTPHGDVWYEFTAVSSVQVITLQTDPGAYLAMSLYSGYCATLTVLDCKFMQPIQALNLTIGETYKLRVFSVEEIDIPETTFNANFTLCVVTTPNPVSVTTGLTETDILSELLPQQPCNEIVNFIYATGTVYDSSDGIGLFQKNETDFPFNSGIVLSTGKAANIAGANTYYQWEGSSTWPGDDDLYEYINGLAIDTGLTSLKNATYLEFNFVPQKDHISFDYIFGAEEYGTFQCGTDTDYFAILLTNVETSITTNIAVIPGTTIPVNVITIHDNQYNTNCTSVNAEYFGNYYAIDDILAPVNFNGITVPLTAEAAVIPGQEYHIKFVIADRNLTALDSALFLDGENFDLGFPDISTIALTTSGESTVCNGSPVTLTVNGSNEFIYNWYFNGNPLPDAASNELTINSPGVYTVQVTSAPECTIQLSINIEGSPFTDVSDYTIYEEDTDGFAEFDLSQKADEIVAQLTEEYTVSFYLTAQDAENNANPLTVNFINVSNPQTIYARAESTDVDCLLIVSFELKVLDISDIVPPPIASPSQTFTDGQTLADLEVDGENIQWYDNPGEGPVFPDGLDIPLPLTTLLVDGVTYYASQTVGGIESIERFGVTVNLVLDSKDNALGSLRYYPNPAKDVLTIENTNSIDTVSVTNTLGQAVFTQKVNGATVNIDLSSLGKGVYFVAIASGWSSKTVKVIKE